MGHTQDNNKIKIKKNNYSFTGSNEPIKITSGNDSFDFD
jgi:hypothetical protein